MNAGRELDALIAEKVMGFTWHDGWKSFKGPHLVSPGGFMAGWRMEDGGVMGHLDGVTRNPELPFYSTDIAAAWQVVEKLVAERFFPEVNYRGRGEWGCKVDRLTVDDSWNDKPTPHEIANTAPLAICLAALSAVRHLTGEAE